MSVTAPTDRVEHAGGGRHVVRRSVLDLAVVPDGATSADALAETTALARRAEGLGFDRFWVAEHHNFPTIASTSPAVLIAHLAASTSRIRIGSGGVMLPNHPALVVAEQFALLEALHPGRIDLGIGRAPGTDPATAAALRRSPQGLGAEDFPNELIDLMGLLGDRRREHGAWDRFRATPQLSSSPEIVLLGSSEYSAQLAGILGLPYAFAHHFDIGTSISTLDAIALYRQSFRASGGARRAVHDRDGWGVGRRDRRTCRVPRGASSSRHAGAADRPAAQLDLAGRGGAPSRSGSGDGDAVEPHRR